MVFLNLWINVPFYIFPELLYWLQACFCNNFQFDYCNIYITVMVSCIFQNGCRYYKVRWVKHSWEPATSFGHLEHLIHDFWKSVGQNSSNGTPTGKVNNFSVLYLFWEDHWQWIISNQSHFVALHFCSVLCKWIRDTTLLIQFESFRIKLKRRHISCQSLKVKFSFTFTAFHCRKVKRRLWGFLSKI